MRWFFIIAFIVVSLLPAPVVAQVEKPDLILRLAPGSYFSEVHPGENHRAYMEIENSSKEAITGIKLYADAPRDWIVELKPDNIAYLAPGAIQTIDINIKPASSATRREYTVTIIAESNQVTRRVMGIWMRVERTSSLWLWIGVAIGAAVVAGFILVYRHFGRQ